MRICICIPTYNQSAFVTKAVESCLSQTGVEVQVIVSDDASTDDTPTVMRRFNGDPRVVYHRQPENRGIAANAGWVMAQADTEFFVRLDSDDLLAPDYCATLAEALRQNPTAGVAHASVREIDQHDQYRRMRILARAAGLQSSDMAIKEGINGYRVAANICMFRRAAIPIGGVYRKDMNFCEDWDLFLRIADAGWANVYIANGLCSYRVWLDKKGVRAKRRLVEIQGICRVFEETLEPAWRRRGWPMSPLRAARSHFACSQASSLAEDIYTSQEKAVIIDELRLLSPNDNALSRRIRLMRSPIAPTLLAVDRAKLVLRDKVKRALNYLKHRTFA
jgi:glycosyltransferase involved in cell wall biosynthesis